VTAFLDLEFEHTRLEALRRLEEQLVAAGQWAAGPATMFAALGLTGQELANCRFLGWLLDPLAPHGLGTRLLQRLLTHLNNLIGEDRLPTASTTARTTVVLEDARTGTRADLVLYGVGWTVVIEAKLGASEQPEQGMRLAREWPDATYVFLTRRGRPMETAGDHDWTATTWTAIRQLVADTLHEASPPPTDATATARSAVRDYLIATGHLEHPIP
jgi:hypothetical protein